MHVDYKALRPNPICHSYLDFFSSLFCFRQTLDCRQTVRRLETLPYDSMIPYVWHKPFRNSILVLPHIYWAYAYAMSNGLFIFYVSLKARVRRMRSTQRHNFSCHIFLASFHHSQSSPLVLFDFTLIPSHPPTAPFSSMRLGYILLASTLESVF